MDISNRLKFIIKHIDRCNCIADIGSDHGYIPIYAVKNNLCNKAIASDINKGPVEKAKLNASSDRVSSFVDVRLGSGLKTINAGEANGVIIAGMGGNLIIDILKADIEKVKLLDFIILQPAQNPEVLREYLYNNGYDVLKEDLCFDEGIFYELFKVKKSTESIGKLDKIYYEISPEYIKGKEKVYYKYLDYKKDKYEKILSHIKDNSESAKIRKSEINKKIQFIEDLRSKANES